MNMTLEDQELLAGGYDIRCRSLVPNGSVQVCEVTVAGKNGSTRVGPMRETSFEVNGKICGPRPKLFSSKEAAERWIQQRVAELVAAGHIPWEKK